MMQSVQVLIERLKTHPEDFFGDLDSDRTLTIGHTKFYDIVSKLDDLLTHPQEGRTHRLWYLTDTERIALLDAYKEARRARFEAKVFHRLLAPQEKEDHGTITFSPAMKMDANGGLGLGTKTNPWGNVVPKQEGERVEYYVQKGVPK